MQLPGKGLIFRGLIRGLSEALDISPMIAHLLIWVACGALLLWLDPFPRNQQIGELTDADRAYAKLYCSDGKAHPAPPVPVNPDSKAYVERLCAEVDKQSQPTTLPETYGGHLLRFASIWLALHLVIASIWYRTYGPTYLKRPSKGCSV
jgi:hypothetical protein